MSNKLISVNVLTYNGEKLIGPCLKSVSEQTYPYIEVLIIDNDSKDKSVEKVRETKIKFPLRVIENKENAGFAAGHNQGIRESKGEYVFCLNQDIVLEKDFIEKIVESMEKDEKIGAMQGRLYKIDDINNPRKEIIDTTGLLIFKNRRVINRGQGEKENGQYPQSEEIFGADGAAPVYRRKALEDVKIENEYFDESFFCYKEDIDLSWRMRIFGWKIIYEPKAVGCHLRGAGETATTKTAEIIRQRRKISPFVKLHSFKNQRLMQIKNELPGLFFSQFFSILIKEIGAWAYVLVFEHYTWKAIQGLIRLIPVARKKRKLIMANKKVSAKEMVQWFK